MKYSGEGILADIVKIKPIPYTPLTMEDLRKFLRDITRHRLRDSFGRFKKKPVIVILNKDFYEKEL